MINEMEALEKTISIGLVGFCILVIFGIPFFGMWWLLDINVKDSLIVATTATIAMLMGMGISMKEYEAEVGLLRAGFKK